MSFFFIRLFATGVSKCPNHVPLYQAWACLEIRGENYEKAKIVIGEALTRDKSEGSGWLVAAKIEEKLGNEGLMIMILRRGLECAPNSADLYCAVADYEVNRGKIDLVCDTILMLQYKCALLVIHLTHFFMAPLFVGTRIARKRT